MARKNKTPLNHLDDALGVLNGARIAFHPEDFHIVIEEGDIFCEWVGPPDELPVEVESAIGLALMAAALASKVIDDECLQIVEDHRDRWVAVPRD